MFAKVFYENHINSMYPKYKHNIIGDIRQTIIELENVIESIYHSESKKLFELKFDLLIEMIK